MSPADSLSRSQTVLCLSKLSLCTASSPPFCLSLLLSYVSDETLFELQTGRQAAPLKCQVQCGETPIYTHLVQRQAGADWNESLKSV